MKPHASAATVFIFLFVSSAWARDDGRQIDSEFRLNYLGYFSRADKIALFLSETGGSKAARQNLPERSGFSSEKSHSPSRKSLHCIGRVL